MAHSEICPVCGGTGKKQNDTTFEKEACYGCNGRGWVEIQDNPIYPIYPMPIYPLYPYPPNYPWITYTGSTGTE
jgi:hypothetical protein